MAVIYHIADVLGWTEAQQTGIYIHPSLKTENFIHCSAANQIEATANRYFKNMKDILILTIEVEDLQSELRYESASSGDSFPHVYGPLNVTCVKAVTLVQQGDTGYCFNVS